MNDDLITLVRQQRAEIPMTTPVEEIIARGRTLRARRRIPALAGGALVAAVLAVVTLVPGGHHPTQQVNLAAWTVSKQADGKVTVTIRQLRDPEGLAAALRADGVPAYVAFANRGPAICAIYPTSAPVQRKIYQVKRDNLVIDPSTIPDGAGLFIMDIPLRGKPVTNFHVVDGRGLHIGVVRAGSGCPLG